MAKAARSKSGRARARGAPQTRDQPTPRTQDQLVAFLELPASYLHHPAKVRVIQTHISWVFIASPFVFKVKKPVNLGFLDFSTLEKRHYFCQREIELNRRLCPEIYLDAVPIYEAASSFSFKPRGKTVEYAVQMRELPHDYFLIELLEKNLVGEKEINRVISTLHRFYQAESPTAEIEQWGTPEKLKISTDENFTQVEPFVGKTISSAAFEAIRHYTNQFYKLNENLFRQRIQQHRILDCHGDLHLDHVHLTPEATTIFDCIEFNDRFRFIDIANDLAFLAMNFDFEGRADLGNLFLRNAARELGDAGMLRIANFYQGYRAVVRGKVESIQATEKETTNRQEHEKQAARYFRLALRYTIASSEPLVIVVIGRVGTGKSTIAKRLAGELDWPVFSSDEIRKTLAGVPLAQRTPPDLRAKIYSAQKTQRTYRKLLEDGFAAIGCSRGRRPRPRQSHNGVILDATFSRRALRRFLRDECKKANVSFQFVELEADPHEIKRRLRARDEETAETSDARLEDFQKLSAAYEAPSELAPGLIRVSRTTSISDAVKTILLCLAERQVVGTNRRAVRQS
ncbi:MAG: phosphotransferase [Verrucomicrobia bacterium]|nr:MAG: phosphotransferase [Verrucomicrobiota bacterium]